MGAAVQMIVGGAFVTLFGTALGEWSSWKLNPKGLGAIAYLVVFGSIVGYSAYAYALRHASATIVGTYAYVNPVIAVLLGWAILEETIGPTTLIAGAIIVVAVAFGVWFTMSYGADFGTQYFAGYIVEKSLSVDNLFVFVIIMTTTFGFSAAMSDEPKASTKATERSKRMGTPGVSGPGVYRGAGVRSPFRRPECR